jgi:hypothetical protein
MNPSHHRLPLTAVFCLTALAAVTTLHAKSYKLANELLTAEFDDSGLIRLATAKSPFTLDLSNDSASLTVDGKRLAVPGISLTDTRQETDKLTYTYAAGGKTLQVVYELKPGWHFVSKQLVLSLPADSTSKINSVDVFRAELKTPVNREHKANRTTGAVFLRFGGPECQSRLMELFSRSRTHTQNGSGRDRRSPWDTNPSWNGGPTTDPSPRTASASVSTN